MPLCNGQLFAAIDPYMMVTCANKVVIIFVYFSQLLINAARSILRKKKRKKSRKHKM